MAIDWDMVQFKRKIIDNARYLYSNYIDTTKGLEPLFNRSKISSEKAVCYKNFDVVRVTGSTSGEQITAWKIDDASKINKLYVRAKVGLTAARNGALVLTDSTLENCIFFKIFPNQSNSDFRIEFRENGLTYIVYTESVDLSHDQFYQIEAMIDFSNNTVSAIRDNVEKPVLPTDTFPSFDQIYVGLRAYENGSIPNVLAKDVFITWE